ncbi:MAG: general secretion pathway protein GspB [Candidatus Omnitrophica bacterium]|nr:general secretion pathway protein GspB [Candidatus Omnitrophota bacterium]
MNMLKGMKILILILGIIFGSMVMDPFSLSLAADEQMGLQITQAGQQNEAVLLRPKIEYTGQNFEDPFRLLPKTETNLEEKLEIKKEVSMPPELKVNGLVWGSDSPLAIINGQVCKVGDTIENARIESIDKNGVVIEFDWRKFTLPVTNASVSKKNKVDQNEILDEQDILPKYPIRRPNDAI